MTLWESIAVANDTKMLKIIALSMRGDCRISAFEFDLLQLSIELEQDLEFNNVLIENKNTIQKVFNLSHWRTPNLFEWAVLQGR